MKELSPNQGIDTKNRVFWDEPCGSTAFKNLGFNTSAEFDDWFFDYYPYLEKIIPFDSFRGKRVLEVGLGYGSVSQKLIESGASFSGLDIAEGPVELVKSRLDALGMDGEVIQGSVLDCPWEDSSFDYLVSIGCLHHTGDPIKGIKELHRVLKPGGGCVIMVYNAFSYRQWFSSPKIALSQFFQEMSNPGSFRQAAEPERGRYDKNTKKKSAPCTHFVGVRGLKAIFKTLFSEVVIRRKNIGSEAFLRFFPRNWKLCILGPIWGLDLYAKLKK
ncbi:MAG: class I SAM-dependent methyltransferase [Opitutales bacterium]